MINYERDKNSYRRRFLPAHSVGQEISPEINAQITAFVHLMREQHLEGVTDVIPAFTSLLINYDPRVIDYRKLKRRLEKLLKTGSQQKSFFFPYF